MKGAGWPIREPRISSVRPSVPGRPSCFLSKQAQARQTCLAQIRVLAWPGLAWLPVTTCLSLLACLMLHSHVSPTPCVCVYTLNICLSAIMLCMLASSVRPGQVRVRPGRTNCVNVQMYVPVPYSRTMCQVHRCLSERAMRSFAALFPFKTEHNTHDTADRWMDRQAGRQTNRKQQNTIRHDTTAGRTAAHSLTHRNERVGESSFPSILRKRVESKRARQRCFIAQRAQ